MKKKLNAFLQTRKKEIHSVKGWRKIAKFSLQWSKIELTLIKQKF